VNLIEKVKAAIEREGLIPSGATIIVGVSGERNLLSAR